MQRKLPTFMLNISMGRHHSLTNQMPYNSLSVANATVWHPSQPPFNIYIRHLKLADPFFADPLRGHKLDMTLVERRRGLSLYQDLEV